MLFPATANDVSEIRASLLSAISDRATWEASRVDAGNTRDVRNLESKMRYLGRMTTHVERLDAFALGYFAHHPTKFSDIFMSHRRVSAAFNIYAIPKVLSTARALNGGAFDSSRGGDEATIAAVVLAMARGETMQNRLAHAIDSHMQSHGNYTYNSGATQCSSTLRALQALAVVATSGKNGMCQLWKIGNRESFDRLVDASNGKRVESVSAEIDENASDALAHDSATQAGRSASRIPRMTRKTRDSATPTTDTPADPAPVETSELPTPAPAPVKKKGKGKGKKGNDTPTPAAIDSAMPWQNDDTAAINAALEIVGAEMLTDPAPLPTPDATPAPFVPFVVEDDAMQVGAF